ncbi:hypothetical protein FIBSPDRAFT_200182 [Athelia psychrophila]|uniref:Uncharacterized protein n=1 Tax=Athelia psychrophila TaxID=1759441 RepID=A0A165ZJC9_9AGAM|nr:hypothetical protein FIBSPDRAFT_200182 [Fibularhizoctonia sp. CBS 109695]
MKCTGRSVPLKCFVAIYTAQDTILATFAQVKLDDISRFTSPERIVDIAQRRHEPHPPAATSTQAPASFISHPDDQMCY